MPAPQSIARGLAAAADRDWCEAARLLSRSDGIDGSVAALEALALACWWLEDGPGFLVARERLFRRHQDDGDTLLAARVAVRLSWDTSIVGRAPALARAWLDRGRALFAIDGAGDSDGAFCDLREAALIVDDEPDVALLLARSARAAAQRERSDDLEVLALVCEGEALFALGEVGPAMRSFEEAMLRVCSGDATDPLSVTRASCTLLGACADVRDYARAADWLPRVVACSAASERGTMAVIGRCTSVPLLLGRGLWRDAAAAIEDGLNHFGDGNERWERSLLAALAELRLRQGRLDEAALLVDQAEPDRRCRLLRASLALSVGDHALAREHAAAYLRQAGQRVFAERAAAWEILAIAESAVGSSVAAHAARDALALLVEHAGTPSLMASLRRADAAIARAAGAIPAAIDALLDAVDGYERAGAVFESSAARLELADMLDAANRSGEATRHRQAATDARAALDGPPPGASDCPLTPRELEVLALVARGLSNAGIAEVLVVSKHTVHRHVSNILARLGCSTRAAAVAVATSRGWLP